MNFHVFLFKIYQMDSKLLHVSDHMVRYCMTDAYMSDAMRGLNN